ncbi:MAG: hypothetical protein BroJett003_24530 [Planctomycetota bacterium]|nr:MAG: hypothetical protein BroJett003_24530 [Planctomycetota bacterium]
MNPNPAHARNVAVIVADSCHCEKARSFYASEPRRAAILDGSCSELLEMHRCRRVKAGATRARTTALKHPEGILPGELNIQPAAGCAGIVHPSPVRVEVESGGITSGKTA